MDRLDMTSVMGVVLQGLLLNETTIDSGLIPLVNNLRYIQD